MDWQRRLRELILAGGVFTAATGCGSDGASPGDAAADTGAAGTGGSADGAAGTGGGGSGGSSDAGDAGGSGGGADASVDTGALGGTGGSSVDSGVDAPLPGIPCGNANPDPCICGRPDASAQARAACDAKMACEASGGTWTFLPEPAGQCHDRDGGTPDAH